MSVRMHILYPFRDGPWGGGNQFLKALRSGLRARDAYAETPDAADVVLFNANPESLYAHLAPLVRIKRQYNPAILCRMDGPTRRCRPAEAFVDMAWCILSRTLFQGTVFQSAWSRDGMDTLGYNLSAPHTVIHNSPDPALFHPAPVAQAPDGPIPVMASSWSASPWKGFDILAHLDEHLDFSRYSLTFVGTAPQAFRNIRHIPPVPSARLGELLRAHRVYIAPGLHESCSNALLEALHCGLAVVARDSGSNAELVGQRGVLFQDAGDVTQALDRTADIPVPAAPADLPDQDATCEHYLRFARSLCAQPRPALRSTQAARIGLLRAGIHVRLAPFYARVLGRKLRERLLADGGKGPAS